MREEFKNIELDFDNSESA